MRCVAPTLLLLIAAAGLGGACILPTEGTGTRGGTGGVTATGGGGGDTGGAAAGGSTGGTGGSAANGAAGSGTGGQAATGGAGGTAAGGPTYGYRRNITITANATVPTGYSLAIQLDHAALVSAGKSLDSGQDVRLFRSEGIAWTEIDRALDPSSSWNSSETMIWFQTQHDIPTSGSDHSYYVYYGDPTATNAPDDPTEIYAFWDSFDGSVLEPNWTFSVIGSGSGSYQLTGGHVHIVSDTGDIWGGQDDFVFLHRDVTGSFKADALVSASDETMEGWAKVGGVIIRHSLAPGSRNRLMSPVNGSSGPASRTNSFRMVDGGDTDEAYEGQDNPIPEYARVIRAGNYSSAWHSDDGIVWHSLGDTIEFVAEALGNPILVGIPFCTHGGGEGWVDIEWFRLMRYVFPEPAVSLGPEEPGPF